MQQQNTDLTAKVAKLEQDWPLSVESMVPFVTPSPTNNRPASNT